MKNTEVMRFVMSALFASLEACYNTVSGCLCLGVRAAPLEFGMTAGQLRPAVIFLLGTLTLRYGQGSGRCCDQAYKSGCKFNHLRDQVHGHLTSPRKGGRCQRTGLTPPTFFHYTCNTGTFVLNSHFDMGIFARRKSNKLFVFARESKRTDRSAFALVA